MNIAELFVRVNASTGNLPSEMARAGKAIDGVGIAGERLGGRIKLMSDRMGLSESTAQKMKGGLATLASQVTGMNPAITQLSSTIGTLALGGPVVGGVLLGITAIAGAYAMLTKGAREARAESKSLADQLIASMKLSALGPGGSTQQNVRGAVDEQNALIKQRPGLQRRVELASGTVMLPGGQALLQKAMSDLAAVDARIAELTQAVVYGEKQIYDARMSSIKGLETTITSSRSIGEALVASISKGIAGSPAISLTPNNATMTPGALTPKVAEFGSDAKNQWDKTLAQGNQQIAKDAANASGIKDSIAASASVIVSALNIGGGGKGSSLGGALGGGLGGSLGAAGGTLGILGGPLGSVLGSVAGSLIGSLFNKKAAPATKALNGLAEAARNVTESLKNIPGGFNVNAYRNRYADPRTTPPPTGGGGGGGGDPYDPLNGYKPGGGFPMIHVQGSIYVTADSESELVAKVKKAALRGGTGALRYAVGNI